MHDAGAQRWSVPHSSEGAQSVSAMQPCLQAGFRHGAASQMRFVAAALQSASVMHVAGGGTGPPHAMSSGTTHKEQLPLPTQACSAAH